MNKKITYKSLYVIRRVKSICFPSKWILTETKMDKIISLNARKSVRKVCTVPISSAIGGSSDLKRTAGTTRGIKHAVLLTRPFR